MSKSWRCSGFIPALRQLRFLRLLGEARKVCCEASDDPGLAIHA